MDVLRYILSTLRKNPARARKGSLWLLGLTGCFAAALFGIRWLSVRNVPDVAALVGTLDIAIAALLGLVLLQLLAWALSLEILRLEAQQDDAEQD